MKIALLTTNLRGGGAEKGLLGLAEGFAGRGHEVHLVLLEDIRGYAAPPKLTVHSLTPAGRSASKGWFGKWSSARKLARALVALSANSAFDLVVSTLPYCDEVAHRAGITPLWFRIANTLSAEIRRLGPGKGRRRLERYRNIYGKANLVAVSEGVAVDMRVAIGCDRANIVTIPNPLDLDSIRARSAEHVPDLPREPYVVHAGRFAPQKRHDLLFAAFRRSGLSYRLVLLVEPDPRLTALIRDSGLEDRIQVAGFRSNPYPWLARAELLVLCSDHEGMPNVLVEALACGTRVVSTDCPSGPREILQGELSRFLVPCGDAEALAAAMRAALAAPRPQAPAILRRFAPETVLAAYEALPSRRRKAV